MSTTKAKAPRQPASSGAGYGKTREEPTRINTQQLDDSTRALILEQLERNSTNIMAVSRGLAKADGTSLHGWRMAIERYMSSERNLAVERVAPLMRAVGLSADEALEMALQHALAPHVGALVSLARDSGESMASEAVVDAADVAIRRLLKLED